MGSNLFLGVFFHCIGGFASATNFIPFRGIKRWSWEVYWLLQSLVAWIVIPAVLTTISVPHLSAILHAVPTSVIVSTMLWGALWGLGAFSFGLAVRYLGIALGYAIVLGLAAASSTSLFLIRSGKVGTVAHERSGQILLVGVILCLASVALAGVASLFKQREVTIAGRAQAGETDFAFGKGILAALFAGVFSSCFVFSLAAGAPIAASARRELIANGKPALWQTLPVLLVILWGGFATNLIGSAFLILRNRSFAQLGGIPGSNPMRSTATSGDTLSGFDPRTAGSIHKLARTTLFANYTFAALAGTLWFLQLFFYFLGGEKMGRYAVSSWESQLAFVVLFAMFWGGVLGEWREISRRTRGLIAVGFGLLLSSILVIGYGSFTRLPDWRDSPLVNRR